MRVIGNLATKPFGYLACVVMLCGNTIGCSHSGGSAQANSIASRSDPAHVTWAVRALFGQCSVQSTGSIPEAVSEQGRSLGISVIASNWESAQARVLDGQLIPALLISSAGFPYLLIDRTVNDGRIMYTLLSSEGRQEVIENQNLARVAWKSVLSRADRASPDSYEIEMGQCHIRVDKQWHSFGLTRPFSKLSTSFHVVNVSGGPLLIRKVATSCGCTVVDPPLSREVPEGASFDLPVSMVASASELIHQTVSLALADDEESEPIVTTLHLYAWEPASVEVEPKKLNLDVTHGDSKIERTIRLTEKPTDRFQLESVSFEDLPATYEVDTSESDGLNSYLVRVHTDLAGLSVGAHSARIRILTTSRLRPEIGVPVQLNVKSEIALEPPTVEFDEVRAGKVTPPKSVVFRHAAEKALRLSVIDAPKGVAAVVDNADCSRMTVRVDDGVESSSGSIKVSAKWDGGEEEVKVPCYVFAIP